MYRTLVLNVVGLTPALLGDDTPHLKAFVAQGGMRPLATITPAVTCSVQATLLTGLLPREHGIVANGWYFRELAEVMFWRQSNQLVAGEKIWEAAKRRDPSFRCAKLFWWYNMYSSADLSVTPRPMYPLEVVMRPLLPALLLLSLSFGACSRQHARPADAGFAAEPERDGSEEAADPDEATHELDGSPSGDGEAAEPDAGEDAEQRDGEDTSPPPAQAAGDAGSDADVCSVQKVELSDEAPDVLIVFDRSGSMTLEQRWEPSKQAIKAITQEFEGVVAFGLETFPGPGATEVDPNDIISLVLDGGTLPVCSGEIAIDLPVALRNAAPIAMALDAMETVGFTPTAEALRVAATYLGDRSPARGAKPGYVLLVTDGDPVCDLNTVVDPAGPGDAVEREGSKAAVSVLKQNHIATYVVGYQIDSTRQPFMNELAVLGGTGRYRPVEGADQLLAVLREISAGLIDCDFELRGGPPDPAYLQVRLDGVYVARGADGWSLAGRTVTLGGSACETLRNGAPHRLELQLECEPVSGR